MAVIPASQLNLVEPVPWMTSTGPPTVYQAWWNVTTPVCVYLYDSLLSRDGKAITSVEDAEALLRHPCFRRQPGLVPVVGICLDVALEDQTHVGVVIHPPNGTLVTLFSDDRARDRPPARQFCMDVFQGLSQLELCRVVVSPVSPHSFLYSHSSECAVGDRITFQLCGYWSMFTRTARNGDADPLSCRSPDDGVLDSRSDVYSVGMMCHVYILMTLGGQAIGDIASILSGGSGNSWKSVSTKSNTILLASEEYFVLQNILHACCTSSRMDRPTASDVYDRLLKDEPFAAFGLGEETKSIATTPSPSLTPDRRRSSGARKATVLIPKCPVDRTHADIVTECRNMYKSVGSVPVVSVLEALITRMTSYSAVPAVQESACVSVSELCKVDDGNRMIVSRCGGLTAIIDAMRTFVDIVAVQLQCCVALFHLCGNATVRTSVVAAGGLELVLRAMDRNLKYAAVQEAGCVVLVRIASKSHEHQLAVVAKGGLNRLYAAMEAHMDAPALVTQVCGCLRNLTLTEVNRLAVLETSGVQRLVDALMRHRAVSGVMEQGFAALGNMTNNETARGIVVDRNGIQLVLDGMEKHLLVSSVQSQGCVVLANLCATAGNQQRVMEAGGLLRVFAAMDKHRSSPSVQAYACSALWGMAESKAVHPMLIRDEALTKVYTAMDQHTSSKSVQKYSSSLLLTLSSHPENKKALLKTDAIAHLKRCRYAAARGSAAKYACGRALQNLGAGCCGVLSLGECCMTYLFCWCAGDVVAGTDGVEDL